MQSKLWTPLEIATLKKLSGKHNFAEIGKQIKRSKDAVRHKAIGLGLFTPSTPLKPKAAPKPKLVIPQQPRKPPVGHAWKAKPIGTQHKFKKEPKSIYSLNFVEYCPQCYAPVSNWADHRMRLGHRRPAA